MKTTILFALILVLSTCGPNFEGFIVRFNKNYATNEERARRQAIYNANWAEIEATNAKGLGFELNQNEFTDLTPEQFQQKVGLKPLHMPENPNPTRPARKLRGTPPLQVDWRTENKVSAVKNQGSCGSCWAFTTTALYESILMISGLTPEPDLSQQYVLECTTANSPGSFVSSCGGGVLEYAIPFVIRTGIPTQADYPYAASAYPAGTSGTPTTAGICTPANLVKQTNITGQYVGTYSDLVHADMKDILSYAPVTGAMFANPAFMSYSSGIYTGCPDSATSIASLNHAVLIIGYDTNGNYIIKNSWGTSWGVNGFATISKDADCGLSHGPREIRGTNVQLQDPAFERILAIAVMLALSLFVFI